MESLVQGFQKKHTHFLLTGGPVSGLAPYVNRSESLNGSLGAELSSYSMVIEGWESPGPSLSPVPSPASSGPPTFGTDIIRSVGTSNEPSKEFPDVNNLRIGSELRP